MPIRNKHRCIPGTTSLKKNEKTGILFFTRNGIKDQYIMREFAVDSISSYYKFPEKKFPDSSMATYTETVTTADGKEIIKFAIHNTSPESIDSFYYYFDKRLNDLPFSFSPTLDSMKKMKLYKEVAVLDLLYKEVKKNGRQTILPRELIHEFYTVKNNNHKQLSALFKRFQKHKNKTF